MLKDALFYGYNNKSLSVILILLSFNRIRSLGSLVGLMIYILDNLGLNNSVRDSFYLIEREAIILNEVTLT